MRIHKIGSEQFKQFEQFEQALQTSDRQKSTSTSNNRQLKYYPKNSEKSPNLAFASNTLEKCGLKTHEYKKNTLLQLFFRRNTIDGLTQTQAVATIQVSVLTTRAFPVGLHAKGMTVFKDFRDLIPGELIMVRIFGLLIALVASVQTANAALLSSWNFNTDTSGTVLSGIGAQATNMVNFGSNSGVGGVAYGNNGFRFANGNHWRTSQFNNQGVGSILADRGSSLTLKNTSDLSYHLTDLSFKAKNQSGTQQRGVQISVSKNGGPEQLIGDYVRTSTTFSDSNGSLDGLILRKDDTLRVFFRFFKDEANATNRQLDIDDININGEVVPEPASLAVFGLVGAGVAFARRRRK